MTGMRKVWRKKRFANFKRTSKHVSIDFFLQTPPEKQKKILRKLWKCFRMNVKVNMKKLVCRTRHIVNFKSSSVLFGCLCYVHRCWEHLTSRSVILSFACCFNLNKMSLFIANLQMILFFIFCHPCHFFKTFSSCSCFTCDFALVMSL